MKLAIANLRLDGGTQPRAEIDPFVVDDYSEAMLSGTEFPAVTVFYDGSDYWLADGFHRVTAAKKSGSKEIEAEVKQGSQRDAILFSVGSNANHGLRRTNADKRRAVERLLSDSEWVQWSNREVSRKCNVSPDLVDRIRKEISLPESGSDARTYTTKHGKKASMKTSKIGKKQKIYEKASEPVKEAFQNGDISVDRADLLMDALAYFEVEEHETILKLCGDNEEKVNILSRLHKSQGSPETNGTFDELMSTGGFHWGDELEKWCNYSAAPIEEIQRGLKSIATYHAKLESDKRREERVNNIVKLSLDNETYPLLYADPPWEYDHQKTPNRAIENHYDTQSLQWICDMEIDGRKVSEIVTPDAVLFMWATNPKLAEAFQVIAAWGFTYVTNMVWVKDKIGQGYYGRSQHELLLIAKRGNIPVALPSDRPSSVLYAPRTEHSAKPHEFYSIIESMYPEYAKLELFSRNAREGWKSWGNDLTEGESNNAA